MIYAELEREWMNLITLAGKLKDRIEDYDAYRAVQRAAMELELRMLQIEGGGEVQKSL
jgi:hypothetical protein